MSNVPCCPGLARPARVLLAPHRAHCGTVIRSLLLTIRAVVDLRRIFAAGLLLVFAALLAMSAPAQAYDGWTITTIAGDGTRGFGGDGGPAVQASLAFPKGVATDGAGNLYIPDHNNDRIRKVNSTGAITTIAGPGKFVSGGPAVETRLAYPISVATDGAGNFYIADPVINRILKVDSTGTTTTIAGDETRGFGGDGGPAGDADIYNPRGVTVDSAGNLYIADTSNHRIRRVDSEGVITTIAGDGTRGFGGDGGPATQAQLRNPEDVAVDSAGNLYIADTSNHRIRRVDSEGVITTIAGSGESGFDGDGGPAVEAWLGGPSGVAVDGTGNLYIADRLNHRVRKVDSAGIITTIAGWGESVYNFTTGGDGVPATQATLGSPAGLAVDGAGNLYIADWGDHRVRKVDSAGIITTIAGSIEGNPWGFSGDGGPAVEARLDGPSGVAVDGTGNLYIADTENNRIRRVNAAGVITTIAGMGDIGDGGPAVEAWLDGPSGVAVDETGDLYIADRANNRIRKVDSAGVITTIAGDGTRGYGGDGGPAVEAWLHGPTGVAVDGSGNLYIADRVNNRIRKVDSAGVITTIAGDGFAAPDRDIGDGGPAVQAYLYHPTGVAVDGTGNLYIADRANYRIRKVDSAGVITTIAGDGRRGFGGDGGPAVEAQFRSTEDVAVDGAGNLYIADGSNNRVRKVDSAGVITTIAGDGRRGFGGDGGPAVQARLRNPSGVAVDSTGDLYISDSSNHRIRKLTSSSGTESPDSTAPSGIQPFVITDGGGVSLASQGASSSPIVGYGQVEADEGMTPPAGLAIVGLRQNGILVSEAGMPAAATVLEGRIFAETDDTVRTGLAIANPNDSNVAITFFFTDPGGIDYGNGSFTLGTREQTARFLDEAPFNGSSEMWGTFTFTSNLPVAVIALRGFINERSEFLMTALPVAPLTAGTANTVYFPHFVDGAGWTTQVILVNPTSAAISGRVQFFGPGSETASAETAILTLADGRSGSAFPYLIPPRSAARLRTSNPGESPQSGSVRVVADAGSLAPSGVSVFSFERDGVTVSEAGVPASAPGAAFRVYVETRGTAGQPHSVRSGIALANTSVTASKVSLELTALDGTATGLTESGTLPASGQSTRFIDEIFPTLRTPFSGILRIASPPISPFHSRANLAVAAFRQTTNERGDVVVTATAPSEDDSATTAAGLFFPLFVDSGGWTTQFILFSGSTSQPASGVIRFTGQNGQPVELSVSAAAQTVP